jgi:hypothetical protein
LRVSVEGGKLCEHLFERLGTRRCEEES